MTSTNTGTEQPLAGGNTNSGVVRVGATVRRGQTAASPAVHQLLRHLEAKGFDGSPRFLGIDAEGREILSFIAGTTGYGKTTGVGAGFQSGAANKAEDYAKHLLDLYGQCLTSIKGKK